jgi:hypothetical protein
MGDSRSDASMFEPGGVTQTARQFPECFCFVLVSQLSLTSARANDSLFNLILARFESDRARDLISSTREYDSIAPLFSLRARYRLSSNFPGNCRQPMSQHSTKRKHEIENISRSPRGRQSCALRETMRPRAASVLALVFLKPLIGGEHCWTSTGVDHEAVSAFYGN